MFKRLASILQSARAFVSEHKQVFSVSAVVGALLSPGLSFADVGVPGLAGSTPNPTNIITDAMISAVANPIMAIMGLVITAAFGLLALRLTASTGFGLIKSFFGSASN